MFYTHPKNIIDGKLLASNIYSKLESEVFDFTKQKGCSPHLAVVLVGNDPASLLYVQNKKKIAAQIGIKTTDYIFSSDVVESELMDLVLSLNQDINVHAILIQLPLPNSVNRFAVLNAILPQKDVDGFSAFNVGMVAMGNVTKDVIVPCTPLACMKLLQFQKINLLGTKVLMIGNSNVVGGPLSRLLLCAGATVTVANSHTTKLSDLVAQNTIIISATGQRGLITGNMVHADHVIVDVGINRSGGVVVGDVDFKTCAPIVKYITPVPGGVGPVTIACLMQNVLQCAKLLLV